MPPAKSTYSLQRVMIIYFLLIGFASLMVGIEFLVDTQDREIEEAILEAFHQYKDGQPGIDGIFKPIQRLRSKAMLMIGIILLVIVIVLTMFIKNITEPLQHMIETSREISGGDLSRTIRINSNNELAMLGNVINELSTNLQEIAALTGNMCNTGLQSVEDMSKLLISTAIPESDRIRINKTMDHLNSEMLMISDVIDYFNFYTVEKNDQ